MASRRPTGVLLSISLVVLAGCGDADRVTSPAATVDEPTSTDVPMTIGPPETTMPPGDTSTDPVEETVMALVQPCRDVPAISTDVVGDEPTAGNLDPIFHGVLLTYAAEHPDTFGGMWIDREANGTVVLAFTDDPAPHLAALATRAPSPDDVAAVEPRPPIVDDRPIGEWGAPFDVVQVRFGEAELGRYQTAVNDVLRELGVEQWGSGQLVMQNRVGLMIDGGVTTEEAIELSAALAGVAPLDAFCLDGVILDERPEPIAPGTPLDVIVLPGVDGTFPPDTEVECGGVQFTLGDLATMTPLEDADPGLLAVVEDWVDISGMGQSPDGWQVLVETEDLATIVRITDGAMEVIGAERGRNGWIWSGAGGGSSCDVRRRLPAGFGQVDWSLDPAFPAPDASSTELHLLVTEAACTGGSEIGERLLGPDVAVTDEAVLVVFAAIPLTGAQACPGNPSTAVTVQLDEPLGDRVVREGLLIASLSELAPA